MAYWWSGDPDERYFMEITRRPDIGSNLFAPLAARGGADTPGYALVPSVKSGDVVIHYDSSNEAIVGVSQASGARTQEPIWWVARGTYARRAGAKPAWLPGVKVELTGYRPLTPVLSLAQIRDCRDALLGVRKGLVAAHPGASLYFPWIPYQDTLRTFQTYLAKFPAEAMKLFPSLAQAVADLEGPTAASTASPELVAAESAVEKAAGRPTSGQGFAVDQAAKVAVEVHAMNLALAHYSQIGTVVDVSRTASYDYVVQIGLEEWHVEVKGTTGDGSEVLLTPNEVNHAREFKRVALFVVSGVHLDRDSHGSVEASGGTVAIRHPWEFDKDRLTPIGFRYNLAT